MTAGETTLATLTTITVAASSPFYLYGAWIIIDAETVPQNMLAYHLRATFPGFVLSVAPVVAWILPRSFQQLNGLSALHAILGLQVYTMPIFTFTGIVRTFQIRWEANLYRDPDQDVSPNDFHESMGVWRGCLRVGVFDYVIFWVFV